MLWLFLEEGELLCSELAIGVLLAKRTLRVLQQLQQHLQYTEDGLLRVMLQSTTGHNWDAFGSA